jgi:hypothetical protein
MELYFTTILPLLYSVITPALLETSLQSDFELGTLANDSKRDILSLLK